MKILSIKLIGTILTILFLGCQNNPNELKFETNILKAFELSKLQRKPILIHFTGLGSGGSNEFMDKFITSRSILNKLNKEYITVQLYVDDKTKLSTSDTINISKIIQTQIGEERIRKSKTIGQINNAIEIELLNKNTQPQYMIVDDSLNLLIEPFGYSKGDRMNFSKQLRKGIMKYDEFKKPENELINK